MTDDSTQTVRAVDRALDILQSFSRQTANMSVVELQKKTRLSRPTLYRLLATLTARGFIRAQGEPQRFGLGPEIARLSDVWSSHVDLTHLARPILESLWKDTGETVALFALRDGVLFCLTELASRHALGISRGVGPLTQHACQGASGKVIMANMTAPEVAGLMKTLPAGTDPADLKVSLDDIRKRRVAVSHGEVIVGAVAIAAPVFDNSRRVVASLALFGPQARLDRPRSAVCKTMVQAAAAKLSGELGFSEQAQ